MRVYLLGMMGAGKSSIGRLLAEKLNLPFMDLDDEIEDRAGKSISEIFHETGEPGFRQLEQEMLHRTASSKGLVVACGGGTPCHTENMDWINAHGLSIFLEVPIEELLSRLADETGHRPLLADSSDVAERRRKLQALYRERLPYYQRAAVVMEAAAPPEAVAEEIYRHWPTIIGH